MVYLLIAWWFSMAMLNNQMVYTYTFTLLYGTYLMAWYGFFRGMALDGMVWYGMVRISVNIIIYIHSTYMYIIIYIYGHTRTYVHTHTHQINWQREGKCSISKISSITFRFLQTIPPMQGCLLGACLPPLKWLTWMTKPFLKQGDPQKW